MLIMLLLYAAVLDFVGHGLYLVTVLHRVAPHQAVSTQYMIHRWITGSVVRLEVHFGYKASVLCASCRSSESFCSLSISDSDRHSSQLATLQDFDMRAPFFTLLAALFTASYAAPPASPFPAFTDILTTTGHSPRTNPTLVRRAGLVPHVNATAIDISPNAAGAYPRLTRLASGTLLASYTVRSGSTRILTVSQSTDGGQTFAALGEIARSTGDLDNAFLLQLANGDVVAAFRNHDLDAGGNPTFYRLTTSVSSDGGRSWVFLSQIAQRAATAVKNGLWVRGRCTSARTCLCLAALDAVGRAIARENATIRLPCFHMSIHCGGGCASRDGCWVWQALGTASLRDCEPDQDMPALLPGTVHAPVEEGRVAAGVLRV